MGKRVGIWLGKRGRVMGREKGWIKGRSVKGGEKGKG